MVWLAANKIFMRFLFNNLAFSSDLLALAMLIREKKLNLGKFGQFGLNFISPTKGKHD